MTELNNFINRFQFTLPTTRQPVFKAGKSAAVLLPIINKPHPTLLLTQRSPFLRSHAGEVAFPGGASDPEDGSPINTALREAYEEVAIPPEKVKVLGQLAPLQSYGGYEVTPIVGLLPNNIRYQANPSEVASIFEVPLFDALSLQRHKFVDIKRSGRYSRIFFYWYNGRLVWGLTASIIHQLALQLDWAFHNYSPYSAVITVWYF
ncbi:CoA pyrophosphatase [Providencia sp. CRE-138-0111]|uniref:CoA pyrophosphatase n=2 Tax=Providencia huashanensis TaxID=3037798 RepID=A0ABT9ALL7_9GAMM|nr:MULTISPECIES: CoA pyrophosphatase [unclassified Providencia]MDO7829397.1 CoA pyrophosphatase [Providencia sp. CRE-138-0026]MDO7855474.1 CoA pyrophosphatase [Providencia sp. CRE-138-0111]